MRNDLSRFCCQNRNCPDYGHPGRENLKVDSRYGNHNQYRMLLCRTCKKRFSERKGSPLFGSQLAAETIQRIVRHLEDGRGIRETARLTGVNRNTVIRYSRMIGQLAQRKNDLL